ncbi:MAG: putative oxidoreductase [Kiritimatiellia bacterium]|jgi:putative oxidoreductase
MKTYLGKILSPINQLLSMIPDWLINLAIRLVIFRIFWLSVQTKITGITIAGQHFAFWNVTDSTFLLFDFEYGIPFIPSELAAYLGTFGEFFLALMILLGFMTRFAALGLFIMTMTIQFFVYPDAWWSVHVYWTLLLVYIMRNGGGFLSVDNVIFKK